MCHSKHPQGYSCMPFLCCDTYKTYTKKKKWKEKSRQFATRKFHESKIKALSTDTGNVTTMNSFLLFLLLKQLLKSCTFAIWSKVMLDSTYIIV